MSESPGIYLISGKAPDASDLGDYGYFGLSIHPTQRLDQHLSALSNGSHKNSDIQRFYQNYGREYIIYTVVEECDLDQLAEREKFRIKEGNTYENLKGFNLTAGGEGVGLRDGKLYCFENTEDGHLITGCNIAMFARANAQFDVQQLYRLSRDEIDEYNGFRWKKLNL